MGSWRQLAALPETRWEAAAVFHGGKVYLLGGQRFFSGGSSSYQNTMFIYDPAGNTWTAGPPLPATGPAYAFSTAADGIHLVFPVTGAHYAIDPADPVPVWAVRTSAPAPTLLRAAHFTDASGRFYLAGGTLVGSGSSLKVNRYDPTTNGWTARADLPANFDTGSTTSEGVLGGDNKVYLGGSTAGLAVYDPATDTWSTTTAPPTGGFGTSAGQVSRLPSGIVLSVGRRTYSGLLSRVDGYNPATGTWTAGVTPDFPASISDMSITAEPGGQIYLLGGTVDSATTTESTAQAWAYKQNEPPTVATLLTMTSGALVSTASTNRARHQFNDPNAGDSQSKFDWRYRKVGDPTWTTGTVISPNPWHDIPAGTLTPGNYERQILTYDAAGEPAPAFTASGFFTAATPPAGPSITYPINGQTLDQAERVDWSIPAQDSYQVRRVADDGAGAPNPAVIYYDTLEVVDTLTRSLPLNFAVNGRTEHVQVRVKDGGLWSDWVSVSGDVSYTPPPAPTFTAYPDPTDGSLLVMIANPDPTGAEPAAAYNDIYITEPLPSGVVTEERRVTEHPANTPWRYRVPVGSWDYSGARIRVVAVAANGTTSSSI
ncbi:Kelch repeat-containing protein [Nocardioides sp. T2.26MG-1]|uniref:Kelch repeat-containing protein n=1 Tax=Nocardioides sp. T2.26MG-1 TaxID=3041166 RepID=UPI00247784DB|nr:kelch repeat-containing protein [Nocardioides sp. T2.26MG-1]CAI9417408.1 N-acetylneuraminate epimerase [Nocardioides sp. T2.26MG-1]